MWNGSAPSKVNGIEGAWELVRYNDIEGYVFNAFLVESILEEKDNPNFRLMMEHIGCGSVNFDPQLNWYGIYAEKGIYLLKPVQVNLEKRTGDMGIPVYTDREDVSIFLFGSKQKLTHQNLGQDVYDNYLKKMHPLFRFPGQQLKLYSSNNHQEAKFLTLNAIGTVKEIDYCPEFENYQLRLSDFTVKPPKHQNLITEFTYLGECNMVEISWFGDLNNDGIADPLFKSGYNHGTHITLFLSNRSDGQKFVERIASSFTGGCY